MAGMTSSHIPEPRVVDSADRRLLKWITDHRGGVQMVSLGAVGLPWAAVPLVGLGWAWLSLAVLPLVAYLMLATLTIEEDVDADG